MDLFSKIFRTDCFVLHKDGSFQKSTRDTEESVEMARKWKCKRYSVGWLIKKTSFCLLSLNSIWGKLTKSQKKQKQNWSKSGKICSPWRFELWSWPSDLCVNHPYSKWNGVLIFPTLCLCILIFCWWLFLSDVAQRRRYSIHITFLLERIQPCMFLLSVLVVTRVMCHLPVLSAASMCCWTSLQPRQCYSLQPVNRWDVEKFRPIMVLVECSWWPVIRVFCQYSL